MESTDAGPDTTRRSQHTHTKEERRKRKEEMPFFFPLLLLSLPIGHSKHTTKKDTAEKGEKEEERDAHRLVVDKKEGEQSHGKRGSGGGR